MSTRPPVLTVIIPTRNESAAIAGLLRSLAKQDRISECQVIVVDGMSSDSTVEIAQSFPFVEVVTSDPGLEVQMNRAAHLAGAPVLWFLHADTTLRKRSFLREILAALEDPAVVAGAFRFHLRGDSLFFRAVSRSVNLRARLWTRIYGDQGIFCRTQAFWGAGGVRRTRCGDLDLVLRLKRLGRIKLLLPRLETSARTWQRYGRFHTLLWHLMEWMRFEFDRLPRLGVVDRLIRRQTSDHADS